MQTVKMYYPSGNGFGSLILTTGQVVAVTPAGGDVPIDSINTAFQAGLSFKVTVGGTDYYVPPARDGA